MDCDVIKLLPDSVANQIAAGEVIQRPASVIKELVENSIDAGATSVQIIIKDAGRTLIQVVDNGCGLSPTDARMAFERHATSKITTAADLYTLHTMGFRGEALPSIAAVAQIEMRTMRRGDAIGTVLCISESKFESQEPCSTVPGTNLMVKNLFFHMPARRKFLKKDSVELSHILHEFERLALVNTNVEFTIIHNDVVLHQLLPGTLKQRITALFGKTIGTQIVPMGTETSIVKISGFVGLPEHARRRNAPQYFFVNGRNMRHPYFHKAVLSCYSELISAEVQPVYFINFEVDPDTIDVNIHPQKHEIKFENEQPIWQILTAAVRQALGRVNAAGAIDFDSEVSPIDLPAFNPDINATMPDIAIDDDYNPFKETNDSHVDNPRSSMVTMPSAIGRRASSSVPQDWDKLYESFERRRSEPTISPDEAEPMVEVRSAITSAPEQPSIITTDDAVAAGSLLLHNRFILVPAREGVMAIDRRRAHIRVLFDQYMQTLSEHPLAAQQLMFPEQLQLSPSQSAILSTVADALQQLGFDLSFLGDNVWALHAAPTLPGNVNPCETLQQILCDIADTGTMDHAAVIKPAALALARASAISSTQSLSTDQVDSLIASLFSATEAAYTPDGLRTFVIIPFEEIEKRF